MVKIGNRQQPIIPSSYDNYHVVQRNNQQPQTFYQHHKQRLDNMTPQMYKLQNQQFLNGTAQLATNIAGAAGLGLLTYGLGKGAYELAKWGANKFFKKKPKKVPGHILRNRSRVYLKRKGYRPFQIQSSQKYAEEEDKDDQQEERDLTQEQILRKDRQIQKFLRRQQWKRKNSNYQKEMPMNTWISENEDNDQE